MGLIVIALYTSGCLYDSGASKNSENSPEVFLSQEQGNNYEEEFAKNKPIGEKTEVVLYFGDSKGNLVAEQREISKVTGIARETIHELCGGPENLALFETLPSGTRLLDINIRDGLCTIDLSENLVNAHSGGSTSENLTVYSIVNTLTQFSSVDRVQILVEGQIIPTLAGHLDISKPISRDDSLIVTSDNILKNAH